MMIERQDELDDDSRSLLAELCETPIDTLATAWNSNLAHIAPRLQPARNPFVYGRGRATVHRAVSLRITLRPNALGKRLLRHHTYRPLLRLWIVYTPTGGRSRTIGFTGVHLPQ
jgi:hypothetical protein